MLALDVDACVVACILSCKLQAPPENRWDEEVDGYLIGEMDPLSNAVSGEAPGGFADEENELLADRTVAPSAVVLTVDRPEMVLMGDATADVEEAKVDLNKCEVYKFPVDFGDSGWVTVVKVLSSMDPGDEIGLEDSEAASPLIVTGSVLALRDEDITPVETGIGY